MANVQTPKSTRAKHLFSERHARGWIVATVVVILVMSTTDELLRVIFIGASGDAKRLGTDLPWGLITLDVAMLCIALLAASRRMFGITVKIGRAMAVRLKMTVTSRAGKHSSARQEPRKGVSFHTIERSMIIEESDETSSQAPG